LIKDYRKYLEKYSDCRYCKHFIGNAKCKAFVKFIPLEILDGSFNHHKFHAGDNGIKFEVDEEKIAAREKKEKEIEDRLGI
jgi:hypothetical protein